MPGIRYLSGREQFIGLGIAYPTNHPEWKIPLDPAQYSGAIVWTQESLHYWSDGDKWIPLLELPIDTPYIVPPANAEDQRKITLTPYNSNQNIPHTGTIFEVYLTANIESIDPVATFTLQKGEGDWLISLPNTELPTRQYVLDENLGPLDVISTDIPGISYGDTFHVRGQYIGETANSRWSPLYAQTLPERIEKPKTELPGASTTDVLVFTPPEIGYEEYFTYEGVEYAIYLTATAAETGANPLIGPNRIVRGDPDFPDTNTGIINFEKTGLEDGTLYYYKIRYLAEAREFSSNPTDVDGYWLSDWSDVSSLYTVANSIVFKINTLYGAGSDFAFTLTSNDPTISGRIIWGDSTSETFGGFTGQQEFVHTYPGGVGVQTEFRIQIGLDPGSEGKLSGFNNIGDNQVNSRIETQKMITELIALGNNMGLTTLVNSFNKAANLKSLPTVLPTFDDGNGKINTFYGTFADCTSLTKPRIENWDVSGVENFDHTFQGCTAFDADLSKWKPVNLIDMSGMFNGCTAFKSSLSGWADHMVQLNRIENAFINCKEFNSSMDSWGTAVAGIDTFNNVFYGCTRFNQPLNSWFSANNNVRTLNGFLAYCSSYSRDIKDWDLTNVVYAQSAFFKCISLNFDASNWRLSNLLDGDNMFYGCTSLTGTAGSGSTGFNGLVMPLLESAQTMFYSTPINPDVSGWIPAGSKLYNARGMFQYAKSFVGLGLENWDVSTVNDMSYMFYDCTSLTAPNIATNWNTGLVGASTNSSHGMAYMFRNTLINQDFGQWNYSNVRTIAGMFQKCTNLGDGITTTFANLRDPANPNRAKFVNNLINLFNGCKNFNENLTVWDISGTTQGDTPIARLDYLFGDCIVFNNGDVRGEQNNPLTSWDVSTVTYFNGVFYDCFDFNQNIAGAAPGQGWDVSNGVSFNSMFNMWYGGNNEAFGRNKSQANLQHLRLDKAQNCYRMFGSAGHLNFDPSLWFENKVTNTALSTLKNIGDMFRGCSSFTGGAGMSAWPVQNVTNFTRTFEGCTSFNRDISDWDVSSGENFDYMFYSAYIFNFGLGRGVKQAAGQGIDKWDMSAAETVTGMFRNAYNGFNQNMDTVVTTWQKVTDTRDLFWSCDQWNNGDSYRAYDPLNPEIGALTWDLPLLQNAAYMFAENNSQNNMGFAKQIKFVAPLLTNVSYLFYNNKWYSQQDALVKDLGDWFDFGRWDKINTMEGMFDAYRSNELGDISPDILAYILQRWADLAVASTGVARLPIRVKFHAGASEYSNASQTASGLSTEEALEILEAKAPDGVLEWEIFGVSPA